MSNLGRVIVAAVIFLIFSSLLVGYSLRAGQRMSWESKQVVNEFYLRSQKRDYAGAHQLLSRNLKTHLNQQTLEMRWQAFEAAHGPIRNWLRAGRGRIGADKVSIWPRYADFTHWVTGKTKGSGQVAIRMIPEDNTWRIERLSIQP